MRLIPAIDLKDGHCVRLLRGDFNAETRYGSDPQALCSSSTAAWARTGCT